jgi:uncharacterized protein involved in exopolysaccharide biosynthesis
MIMTSKIITNTFIFASSAVLFCGIVAVAFAQTDPATTTASSTLTATTSVPAAEPASVPLQTLSQSSLSIETQVRIVNLAANISNRMDGVIKRFEQILIRLESRAAKMAALGYDTADTQFYIVEAQGALNDAKTRMSGIDTKVVAIAASEKPWEAWVLVRSDFTETKAHLIRAKKLLGDAVDDMRLKESQGIPTSPVEADASATTTPTQQ